jgi:hypothetical protein
MQRYLGAFMRPPVRSAGKGRGRVIDQEPVKRVELRLAVGAAPVVAQGDEAGAPLRTVRDGDDRAAARAGRLASGLPAAPNEVGNSGLAWSCALTGAGMAISRRFGGSAAGAIAAMRPSSIPTSTGQAADPSAATPRLTAARPRLRPRRSG